MLESGANFERYGDRGPERLYHVMPMYDGLKKLKSLEPSTYKLPWERERAVWGDPDQGMVSITDGDHRLMACLGMNNGTHISNIARFDYKGPRSHRVGSTELRRKEFPLDRYVKRPNARVTFNSPGRGMDYGTRSSHDKKYYMPWLNEKKRINQYLAGEEVPLASQPNGDSWPAADRWPKSGNRPSNWTGFCYFYREADVGPYRIGINSTGDGEGEKRGFGPGQTFKMEVPDGGAIDLATGKKFRGGTVTVAPRQTRVLKALSR